MVEIEFRSQLKDSKQIIADLANEIFARIDLDYGITEIIKAIEEKHGLLDFEKVIAKSREFPYHFTDSRGQERMILLQIEEPRYVPFDLCFRPSEFVENYMTLVNDDFRRHVQREAERHLNLMDEINANKGQAYDWLCKFPSPRALLEKHPHVEHYMPASYFEDEPLQVQLDKLLDLISQEDAA